MDITQIVNGRIIRLHPASDWFARGVVYARVVGIKKGLVRAEHDLSRIRHRDGSISKRRIWLRPENILSQS